MNNSKVRLYTILITVCFYIISTAIPYRLWISDANIIYWLNICTRALFLIIIFIYLFRNNMLQFEFARPNLLHLLFIPLVLLCISNYFVGWFQGVEINSYINNEMILKGLLLYVLVAIGEEICFRGLLLKELLCRFKPIWAIVISALIFGAIHLLNITSISAIPSVLIQCGYATVLGLITGLIYCYGKNLIYVILFHLFFNFVNGALFENLYTVQISTSYYLINVIVGVVVLLYAFGIYWYLEKVKHVSKII